MYCENCKHLIERKVQIGDKFPPDVQYKLAVYNFYSCEFPCNNDIKIKDVVECNKKENK